MIFFAAPIMNPFEGLSVRQVLFITQLKTLKLLISFSLMSIVVVSSTELVSCCIDCIDALARAIRFRGH